MKALVYTANEEMTYRDEQEPVVNAGDALVAIESVGICGSDMHAYLGHDERRVPPLILGHEAVGTVLEGGASVAAIGTPRCSPDLPRPKLSKRLLRRTVAGHIGNLPQLIFLETRRRLRAIRTRMSKAA